MRRVLVTAFAVLGLLAPASALAVDHPVTLDSATGFSQSEIVIKPGDSVTFTTNAPITDGVQFEDESPPPRCTPTGTEPNCKRDFPTAGQFRFYDSPKCADYASCAPAFRGIVIVDGPPTVTSLSGPGTAQRGQVVTFTATASDPNGDSISIYNWDFGDGQTTTTGSGSVTHTYATAGHFTIRLTVTDSRGNVSAPVQIAIDITIPDRDGDGLNDDADACPDLANATPDGCPPPPAIIVPPAITTSAIAASLLGQAGVIKSGVTTVLTCSDTCTSVFSLLPITTLTGFSFAGTPLATQTVTLTGGGSRKVALTLSAAAKTALAKAKNPKLRLQAVVTDGLARVQTLTATISLKAVPSASKLPAIGISDQQATTFSDPLFRVLDLRYARLVLPWNAITTEPSRLDAWLQAARADGVRPLVSFEHGRGEPCPKKPCRAPSKAQYTKAWKAFHKKYAWVKDISPWNEANSATQPTGKKAGLAAGYYNIVRASCRGCRIVAADLLDTNNLRRYLTAFAKTAKGKPRLWGLHNYRDTNRFRETGTKTLLKLVKGQVWLTETGGIVRFETQSGKVALPKSEPRAKRAMDYMFKIAKKNSKRIKRVYIYQWRVNNVFDRFDAGVVRPDGKPRPSFDVLSLNASVARKR